MNLAPSSNTRDYGLMRRPLRHIPYVLAGGDPTRRPADDSEPPQAPAGHKPTRAPKALQGDSCAWCRAPLDGEVVQLLTAGVLDLVHAACALRAVVPTEPPGEAH